MEHDVVELAIRNKIDELHRECAGFGETLPPPRKEYIHKVPGWAGFGTKRGCKSWNKTKLCKYTVQEAVTAYCMYVAIPGVLTGTPALHDTHHTTHITRHTSHDTHYTTHITRYTSHDTHYTIYITRYTPHDTCSTRYTHKGVPTDPDAKCNKRRGRGGNGLRRHQVVHIRPKDTTNHFDFHSVFLQFVYEHYLQNLIPEVEPDTPAAEAVKWHILEVETRKQLMCSLKCRLQRWQNKRIICKWLSPLWNFINEKGGNQELRLRCFRNLGDLPKETVLDDDNAQSVESLVKKCRRLTVEFLLKYAQGTAGFVTTSPTKKPKG